MDSNRAVPGLAVGQRIEIGLGSRDTLRWLASRLEDRDDAGQCLTVAWPTEQGQLVVVRAGQTVELVASAKDALYSAQVHIRATHNDALPLLDLQVIGPWQRSQRREAVRVTVAIRPRLAERVLAGRRVPLRAGITNLSATGLQLRSQDELHVNDRLALAFALGDTDDELALEAEVRRLQVHERDSVPVWEAGCHFVNIPPALSERIVQFIFAQQRAFARLQRS
jgi:c-di-GMP-binding flagellar brake protein YcgR